MTGTVPDYFTPHRRVTETSVFADGAYPLTSRLSWHFGMRAFRATTEDERQEELRRAPGESRGDRLHAQCLLSYNSTSDRLLYVRLGTAYRPGGIDRTDSRTGRCCRGFRPRSIEPAAAQRSTAAGWNSPLPASTSAGIAIRCRLFEPAGLVAAHNAGDATIFGLEDAGSGAPAGVAAARRLHPPAPPLINAADGTRLPRDRRLPVVPASPPVRHGSTPSGCWDASSLLCGVEPCRRFAVELR